MLVFIQSAFPDRSARLLFKVRDELCAIADPPHAEIRRTKACQHACLKLREFIFRFSKTHLPAEIKARRFLPRCSNSLSDTYQVVPLVEPADLPKIEFGKKQLIFRNMQIISQQDSGDDDEGNLSAPQPDEKVVFCYMNFPYHSCSSCWKTITRALEARASILPLAEGTRW